jgi:hypothetical protein
MRSTPRRVKPTPEQFSAFSAQFEWFNAELFGGRLQPVLLNFSRKAGAAGFFAPERWERDGGTGATHEISVNPETLSQPACETAQTLVHEMVHLWQRDFGEPSRAGYHNRQWAEKMRDVGLEPISLDSDSGTGQRVSDKVIEGGPFARAFARMPSACSIPYKCRPEPQRKRRRGSRGAAAADVAGDVAPTDGADNDGPALPHRNKIRYTCAGCDAHVWGKPGLRIACEDCALSFDEDVS